MKTVYRSWNLMIALTLIIAALALPAASPVSAAACSDLLFTEYIEGSSNNKALEIFNCTGAPVDLAAGGYNVQMAFNGNPTPTLTINLTGTLADRDVFVLAQSSAIAAILAQADQTNGAGWFNGDDAVILRKGTVVIDSIGQAGFDPGSQWGVDLVSTADNTLRRKSTVTAGDIDPTNVFDPALEWDGFAQDTFDGLGFLAGIPGVRLTDPANGATLVESATNLTITFSEAVNVSGDWVQVSCTTDADPVVYTPATNLAVSANPEATVFTLDPAADLPDASLCTVSVEADLVSSVVQGETMAADKVFAFETWNPLAMCGAPVTLISAIQGSGAASPLVGQSVWVEGVVSLVSTGSGGMGGYFIQSLAGSEDSDPATSEGLFIFDPGNDWAAVGDQVRVLGQVSEFTSGSAGQFAKMTELNASFSDLCTGEQALAPTELPLPIPAAADVESFLEPYEGMLVYVPQDLVVQQNFFQGRFGQLTLGVGRQFQSYNFSPYAGVNLFKEPWRSMIVLDDARHGQNPNPTQLYTFDGQVRAGDTLSGVMGVLDQGRINSNTSTSPESLAVPNVYYRIQPVIEPEVIITNPRPETSPEVGGTLKVAAFNVLNYFTTLNVRGANTLLEFQRQQTKIVNAIAQLDADIVGLIEIEALDSAGATQNLVDALNAVVGAGVYAVAADPVSVPGVDDVIQLAIIYKPASVTPVGAYLEPGEAIFDRQPLAQTFQANANGEVFSVVVNHFKSKGCDGATGADLDTTGQGCWNPKRVLQAEALMKFIRTNLMQVDPDVLVVGDLNSYGSEDPILWLEEAGLRDLMEAYVPEPDRYSYVFDGQAGYLDHALATGHLFRQITGAAFWHINADEPSHIDYNTEFKPVDLYQPHVYRSSDHDPVVVGLNLSGANGNK
ncbi:MAG TPA: ExeM/NucH family extracellular endonuclease [Anaerolineaceae bacterium]|nr:ExeM/NucH family extracellular endonuclease [Anaerolineaceae bacterium]